MSPEETSVFRHASISYVRIPASDPQRAAAFYEAVFGWTIRGDSDHPSFTDGSGHVIGAWQHDLPIAGEAGVLPYIYVNNIDETIATVSAQGGEVTAAPYPEGDLWVAMFRDPSGNAIGIWQRGPRT